MPSPIAEVHYVPEPTVLLTGCRAWPPPPNPDGSCAVCGGQVRRENPTYHCLACDRSAPQVEARCRGALIGLAAREKGEVVEKAARKCLLKSRRREPVLSEAARRRLWNGYKGSVLREFVGELTDAAAIGRAWLAEIGQAPDWDLTLDHAGKVVGRLAS